MNRKILVVREYMSPAPQAIGRETTLSQAKQLMKALEIRHLPVLEGEKIVGIISERDVRLVGSLGGIDLEKLLVDDAMSPDPYTVAPDTPLEEVVAVMASEKFGSAVVIENGKPVGIFTTIDALRALSDTLQQLLPRPK